MCSADIIMITLTFKIVEAMIPPNTDHLTNFNLIEYILHPMIEKNQGYVHLTQSQLLVSINTFGKTFNIIVFKQEFKSLEIVEENDRYYQKVTYYQGKLLDEPISEVIGYLINFSFFGIILTKNNIYNIEPVYQSDPSLVIIYRESDVNYTSILNKSFIYSGLKIKARKKRHMPNEKYKYNYENKICEIEIVADHTFTYHYHKKIDKIVTEMLIRVRKVNTLLESCDFNNDNKSDRFGIRVKNIIVYMTPKARFYLLSDRSQTPAQVLQNFSRHVQKHCLAVLFTFRHFPSSILGLAYIASESHSQVGGLCQKPTQSFYSNQKYFVSYNTLIVTDRVGRQRLLRSHSAITLTHEIGHALGGLHDSQECLLQESDKLFIMSSLLPFANNAIFKLSSCSLRSIHKVLRVKGSCLKSKNQDTCGDMIVDKNEECDCGDMRICHIMDPCCIPFGYYNQCKLKPNAQCNQQQGPCCNSQCLFFKASFKNCTSECHYQSQCNGKSSQCPKLLALKKGSPCYTCLADYCTCDGQGNCISIPKLSQRNALKVINSNVIFSQKILIIFCSVLAPTLFILSFILFKTRKFIFKKNLIKYKKIRQR